MKIRIFVVDDEVSYIQLATKILEIDGYVIASETDPLQALKKIITDPPNLVLLDINMPLMNGLDVCKALKSNPKTSGIPIIFASVRSQESDVVAGLELGADDYIQKPLRERELLARVRTVFRRQGLDQAPAHLECGPFRI